MQKQNGHATGTNGHAAPTLQAKHTVGVSAEGYSIACTIAAKTGAPIAAVVSAAMACYARTLSEKDIASLGLENKISNAQKTLNQLLSQRSPAVGNGTTSGKHDSKRSYTKKNKKYWTASGGVRQ